MAGKKAPKADHVARDKRPIFAQRLRLWRTSRKLPLKTHRAEFGIDYTTWHRWETGSRSPSIAFFNLLLRYTGMPACWFFSDDVEPCPHCHQIHGRPLPKKGKATV